MSAPKKYDATAIADAKAAKATKSCGNCGATPTVARERCNACYTHLKRKGGERMIPAGYVPPVARDQAPATPLARAPVAAQLTDRKGRPVDEKGRPIGTDPRDAAPPVRLTRKVMESLGVEREPGVDSFRVPVVPSTTWQVLCNGERAPQVYNAANLAYNRMLIAKGYIELPKIEAGSYTDAINKLIARERAERAPVAPTASIHQISNAGSKRARKAL